MRRWVGLLMLLGMGIGIPALRAQTVTPTPTPCLATARASSPRCATPTPYRYSLAGNPHPQSTQPPFPHLSPLSPIKTNIRYARARSDSQVFRSPAEAAQGLAPARLLGVGNGKGFIYVSVEAWLWEEGEAWYRINKSEYVRAKDLTFVTSSTFAGVTITGLVPRAFGWVVSPVVYPSMAPGGVPNRDWTPFHRYDVIEAYETVRVGYWDWYRVAPGQWVEQRDVSIIAPQTAPPKGVKGKWIEIDLYEQMLLAYEDSHPVFATLLSSGLQRFATEPGLFSIYVQTPITRMSGAYTETKSDYYYLEDVPWTMYFDGERGIHGAYWHDYFGFRRSHGCINLSITDSEWLYHWAKRGVRVWVHDPFPE